MNILLIFSPVPAILTVKKIKGLSYEWGRWSEEFILGFEPFNCEIGDLQEILTGQLKVKTFSTLVLKNSLISKDKKLNNHIYFIISYFRYFLNFEFLSLLFSKNYCLAVKNRVHSRI